MDGTKIIGNRVYATLISQYGIESQKAKRYINRSENAAKERINSELKNGQLQKLNAASKLEEIWVNLCVKYHKESAKANKKSSITTDVLGDVTTVSTQKGSEYGVPVSASTSTYMSAPPNLNTSSKSTDDSINIMLTAIGNLTQAISNKKFRLLHEKFQMQSMFRDYWAEPHPWEFSHAILASKISSKVVSLKLVEIHVPHAHIFYSLRNYAPFFLQIDRVSEDYVEQNDDKNKIAHFMCKSQIDFDTNYPKCTPENDGEIIFRIPMQLPGRLKVTLLDNTKQSLQMPQDIYVIRNAVLDHVNQRTIFTVDRHSLTGGIDLLIRGVALSSNHHLYDDSNYLKAIIIAPITTTVAVDAYEPTGVFSFNKARLISRPNNVIVSLLATFMPED